MTRATALLVCGALCAGAALAQAPAPRETLLELDRATASAVRRDGAARGLAPALDPEALVLLEGAPILRGPDAVRYLDAQPELRTASLAWLPLAVLLSDDGSLGVTYGVTTIGERFGKYVSVWRRRAGAWRLVAHVQSGLLRHPAVVSGRAAPVDSAAGPFAAADRAFARLAADSGAPAAFAAFAAPTAVTFPGTGEILIGPAAIRERMLENGPRAAWSWAPRFAGASDGGDLGFTVGEATITATTTFYSKYVTVWRRFPDGTIRFLADAGNARPPDSPRDGRAVLERMRAAYAGRWYQSLAFVQRTTFVRADGTRDTATWYESLKGPDQLRIDFGAPANGRGGVFTGESSFVFREGKLLRAGAEGNPFLPLIMGVYLQPVDATLRGVTHHGFDVAKVHQTVWQGRPVLVVGAASPADSAVPQFWVDTTRWLVVRMRAAGGPGPGAPLLDVRLDDYVSVGGGWLATSVAILAEGKPRQLEEYTEWSDRVAIADALFDRQQWVTASHWALGERPASLWSRRSP